ncbi:MAG TPA: SDR family oxidoreductase [Anaerolineales bacterium]|jgi:NAD(P)-dependent dehydrogenase (short-subunit alcohol dehydrogenase family)|nr:SDR family oxidoreductase [Pseudomonadales bacterium]MDP7356817.1 SDR family oxidoreductase [Pseudomonadales bacterium]HJL70108.1 SDR family oxidoreductase [Anaerolineales bacterium]HJN49096.1 SDR family oxidoreductase [Pseudomonadales bacterium]|tara:strand:- start:152 stop:847 length:696 start_codon:yes stop_codon:yes gene_type:complete
MAINIDHFDLSGRKAMLIGAETHAGGAIADAFNEAGAKLFNTNVLKSEDVRASVQSAVEELGGLDILVSCPELFLAKSIADTSDGELHLIMEYNFYAQYSAVRTAVDVMLDGKTGGNIILLTHVLGERGLPNTSAYGSAQAATQNLIRSMAQELGRDKITINGISLGWMDWMSDRIDPKDEEAARAIRFTIAKRAGESADIGPMAVWLSGTGVGYVTGQIFAVDGGLLQHL